MDNTRIAELWKQHCIQKSGNFREERCMNAIRITTMEELQESLRQMSSRYGQQRLPRLSRKLQPSLDHLKSFSLAISSAVQYKPVACLVWGGLQAVIECACKVSTMLEEVLELMSDLNNTLPQFQEYLELFPGHSELHWPLQDLYEDYLDYCLAVVKYLNRKPTRNFLVNLWTSTPKAELVRTKQRMQMHIAEFQNEVTLLDRKTVRKHNLDIAKTLRSPMSSLNVDGELRKEREVRFPISTVTKYRNYAFVGRDNILETIQERFEEHPALALNNGTTSTDSIASVESYEPVCCLIHGIGGVGKTQTALEYVRRYTRGFDAIFWLPSERGEDLAQTYSQIADRLKLLPSRHDMDGREAKVGRVREWLEKTDRRWLLVFDNTEDVHDLNAYLPTSIMSPSAIIITTQRPDSTAITERFHRIKVPTFTRDEAASLLFKHLERKPVNEDEEHAAEQIADFIDGLPLAISTIGGYVNQIEGRLDGFLGNLKRSSKVWTASDVPLKDYEKSLGSVFDIALGELPRETRALLNVLAFLDPDRIPEDIFTAHFEKPVLDYLRNEDELIESVRILRRRQLVTRDFDPDIGHYLSIHRTVQWNVLLDLSKNHDYRWDCFRETMILLRRGMPVVSPLDIPEPEKWPEFERYAPQVLNVRTHCLWPEPPVELPTDFGEILTGLATYMWHAGLAEAGHEALHTVIDIFDREGVDKMDIRRSDVYCKLGILMSFNGVSEREETLKRRNQAHDIREKDFNEKPKGSITRDDEIRLYNTKSDLAWTWLHEEDFQKAEDLMEECLKKYQSWDTEEKIPFEYSKYHYVMSLVRLSQGKPDESLRLSKHGIDLIEKASGAQHPMTLVWRFALANITYHTGSLQEAWEMNDDILTKRISVLGEFNHLTLESYSTCAYLLAKLDRLDEAETLMQRCLERRKRYAWHREGVARTQYRYSKILEALSKADEAHHMSRQANQTREYCLKTYSRILKDDSDEEVVFDHMVSMFDGRMKTALHQ